MTKNRGAARPAKKRPGQIEAEKIYAQAEAIGVSITEVCALAGIDRHMPGYWLSGRMSPRMDSVAKVHGALAKLRAKRARLMKIALAGDASDGGE